MLYCTDFCSTAADCSVLFFSVACSSCGFSGVKCGDPFDVSGWEGDYSIQGRSRLRNRRRGERSRSSIMEENWRRLKLETMVETLETLALRTEVGRRSVTRSLKMKTQSFPKSKPNMGSTHKPNPATYRKKSISWKYLNG